MILAEPAEARVWVVYVRRSLKREGDADVSDQQQEAAARARVPAGASVVVLADSGGHNSGFTAERPAYQRMLAMLRAGQVAGVAAWDGSRLNRNAENALALYREASARGVPVLTGETSAEMQGTAVGTLTFNMHASIAQFYRDQQAEKIRAMMQTLLESGRARGPDCLGYATVRDERGRVAQPRTQVVVPEEAAQVVRVFKELAVRPMSEVAAALNAAGVPCGKRQVRGGWTKEAVRSIWRRRRIYLGYAVRKRSDEEYSGEQPPILTREVYAAAVAAMDQRRRANSAPKRNHRTYLLRGVLACAECESRMTGEARVKREAGGLREYRYYSCPVSNRRVTNRPDGTPITCGSRRVIADMAEARVLALIAEARLPESVIDAAHDLLRERILGADETEVGRERSRLESARRRLLEVYVAGDLSKDEYDQRKRDLEAQLASLPADATRAARIKRFEKQRAELREAAERLQASVDRMDAPKRQRLVGLLVERVLAKDRQVVAVEWTPPAEPFFRRAGPVSAERAVWDSNPRHED